MKRQSYSCVIVGGTTLAIECAQRLHAAGHVLQVVLPTDETLKSWVARENVPHAASIEELDKLLDSKPADVLFSIINPVILPQSLFGRVQHAFNYHDAPLPRYAGTHATSWALLSNESYYAITWHRIVSKVDAGDIIVQCPVDIAATDTALSLNLKCYQAAIKGFTEIVESLANSTLTSYAQDLAHRSFFPFHRRPSGAGCLSWQHTAQDLSALVRALDFGDYHPNSLALPKVQLTNCAVNVSQLDVHTQCSGTKPGTLLKIDRDRWHIATGSEDVAIGRFTSLIGKPISAQELALQLGLSPGDSLPMLSDSQSRALNEAYETAAKHESFWLKRLYRFNSLQWPVGQSNTNTCVSRWQLSQWHASRTLENLSQPQRVEYILSAFLIYLARITGETSLQLGWAPTPSLTPSMQTFFATVVPMEIEINLQQNFTQVRAAVAAEYDRLIKHSTFPCDLIARHPKLRSNKALHLPRPWHIVIAILPDGTSTDTVYNAGQTSDHSFAEMVHGECLTFQIRAQDGSFRWINNASDLNDRQRDTHENSIQHTKDEYTAHQHRFFEFLDVLVTESTRPVDGIELLDTAERHHLLVDLNATGRDYPEHQCIHQLFEEQAKRIPKATALAYKDQTLTYAELNVRANCLAHRFVEMGIQSGDCIATLLERSVELITTQLAILKAGAIYVPIDSQSPAERQAWIITDCSARLLVVNVHTEITADLQVPLLRLTSCNTNEINTPMANLGLVTSSLDTAYVMYTSGSTGSPKGVLVPHRAISRLVINNGYVDIGADDRVAFAANPAFDASTFEVWAPLLNGGTLVVIDRDTVLTPDSFAHTLLQQQISVMWMTVGLFNQLAKVLGPVFPQLKTLIVGGDKLDPKIIKQVLDNSPPQRLINGYGPTESTTFTATYEIVSLPKNGLNIPIGRPIANTRIYLLDRNRQLVPLGMIGEIYIGGVGVARGYLNRPKLTAERFLPDPFSDHEDARMYKTGDLARYLPDGNLLFLGRNDNQVKIRGFRIELGEIEARLVEYSQVCEAAAIVKGENNNKRIIAYVVAESDEQLSHNLRVHLTARLPEYMIPAAFVRLDALPLTPNGKINRQALSMRDDEAFTREVYEAPQGEIETILATIWGELLHAKQISRHDNFFALGGNSLLSVQMIDQLRRRNLTVSVRALFDTPTLSMLAQTIGQHLEVVIPPNLITSDTTTLTPDLLPLIDLTQADIDYIVELIPGGVSNIQDIYALSPLQDGILFHHLLRAEGDPYLVISQMAFANRGLLDRYLDIIQKLIIRHDILRTAFIWENLTTPAQVVCRHAPLSVVELTFDEADGLIADQMLKHFDPLQYRTDLTQASLLRFAVAQDSNGGWILNQLLHHIIGDHSTVDVMHSEIQAFLDGREHDLLTPQPYRNLVAQSRLGHNQQAHEQFFSSMLAEIDSPTLPFGLTEVHCDGSHVTESHQMLSQDLTDRLRVQAKKLGVSLASLCHLAWAQVLSRASSQDQVVFGTVLLGRMQAGEGADRTMGLFINTLPIRIDLGERGVRETVRQTHARLARLLEHEHASLVLAQRCSGLPASAPLFSALLNYRHNATPLGKTPVGSGMEFLRMQERTNYPLLLSIEDHSRALGLTAQVVHPLDPTDVCGYMQQALHSLVEALEGAPDMPVRQLEVLPKEERERLLGTENTTSVSSLENRCIHQIFEEQVERTPQSTALAHEDRVVSYIELNARANRLAHQLIEMGVKPDVRVAICVKRSPEMVIGLLAILKSGGAYVPLDPAYPNERLAYILNDAKPSILIADEVGRSSLDETALASLTILDPNRPSDAVSTNPTIPQLTSHHLAYVIYTSGSTGIPKGVMMEHRGIVNLTHASTAHFNVQPSSRVLQFASLSFDVSIWEIFLALSCGAGLQLPPDSVHYERNTLWEYLSRHAITHVILPPALLQHGKDLPSLATPLTMILTGEAPSKRLLQNLRHHGVVFNAYGPTETHAVAVWACGSLNNGGVSIGRPIANIQLYLLDTYRRPVPFGAVGELYIGGIGVARGYLNLPELTAKSFLPNPVRKHEDSRMYKTGDLARYLLDGNLEFIGRNDNQVKIRGYRIEPGEIEANLIEHPQVREAAVLALGKDNGKHLVAYVVADHDEQLPLKLRAHTTAKLPEYMIPTAFLRLDALPLTPNGKLDLRALPAPDKEAFAREDYEAPQGEIETALADIWAELLNIDRIGRRDNFFALGGHSLLAMRMINRIRTKLGVETSLRALFEAPTITELAKRSLRPERSQNDSFSVLFPIRPKGSRPPLFCVHAVAGLSWGYIGLAKYLNADQPIYGLQARGLNSTSPLADSIESMASDYIRQIRSVQPSGPYYLLGWSFGVYVVHSMAVKLEQQGEKVALLTLLDSNPTYSPPDDETEEDRDTGYINFLDRYSDGSIPNAGEYLWGKTNRVIKNNLRLVKDFTPLKYNGDVLFFRATIPQAESIPLITPELWKPYVLGDIEVHNINCQHRDMDRQVPIAEIGCILAQKLDQIENHQI